MSDSQSLSLQGLVIPPPAVDRPPLRVNIFQHMRIANTALCPLFPYLVEGCMAPASVVFRAGEGRSLGMFKHFNSEDEILTVWGASGMRFKPGITLADVKTHLVNIAFNDPTDASSYACLCVLQRQSDHQQEQHEAVTFLCEKCNKPLYEVPFNSSPEDERYQGGFYTPIGAGVVARKFNIDPQLRLCKHCGHTSSPFPVQVWGWDKYGEQCDVVSQTIRAFPGSQGAGKCNQEQPHG